MWYATIFSEGDLLNDDYLQVNRRIERDEETGEYFETYDDRFDSSYSIDERIEYLNSCIERMQAERNHLLKYGDKLVRLGSYDKLEE